MDPNQTCINFIDAVEERRYEDAMECARDLEHWLENGGFIPHAHVLKRFAGASRKLAQHMLVALYGSRARSGRQGEGR